MNNRERENITLSFQKRTGSGSVQETFYPWDLTAKRWLNEGLSEALLTNMGKSNLRVNNPLDYPFLGSVSDGLIEYEAALGLDRILRVFFYPPFTRAENISDLPPEERWAAFKEGAKSVVEEFYNPDIIKTILTPYLSDHQKGEYSVRMMLSGFFEYPRRFFGIEDHLFAFYDYPELMHDINQYLLDLYLERLGAVLEVLPADVLYIMEDLSGKNGPMLSPEFFDEFVGAYYKKLIPFLKAHGVKNVFTDTDGDFSILIPNFIEAGIDGFLPMDVNAGMDIVAVRERYPNLKFIGGFNKLCIAEGKEAIDKEFDRILPVIRSGGYIPGCDHQVSPQTSFENYLYYIERLKDVMKQAGSDL